MPEYVYYAAKKGELEDLICTLPNRITDDQKRKLFPILERDGYDLASFREFVFNWQRPDFAGTVRK